MVSLCNSPPLFVLFLLRWALREQTDPVSAPQTAAFHGLGSDHGVAAEEEEAAAAAAEASHHVHATTVATHHPEAEGGPSGELSLRRITSDPTGERRTMSLCCSSFSGTATQISCTAICAFGG